MKLSEVLAWGHGAIQQAVELHSVRKARRFCDLSWGLSDTEVRERTYEFVQQHKQTVLEAVGKAEAK